MAHQWKLPYRIYYCILLWGTIVLLSSCQTHPFSDESLSTEDSYRSSSDNNNYPASTEYSYQPRSLEKNYRLSSAETLFLNGDFKNAAIKYELLLSSGSSFQQKQLALYGLACTQLILAQNDEELSEAIKNLEQWDAVKGSDPFIENHHMLVLALKHQEKFIRKKNKEQALLNEKKDSLINSQKKKIASMTETVNKLHKQIEELEEIDQISQEKRKPHE